MNAPTLRFTTAGHMNDDLIVECGVWACGHITDGVSFSNGPDSGGWVIAYDDLMTIAQKATEHRADLAKTQNEP